MNKVIYEIEISEMGFTSFYKKQFKTLAEAKKDFHKMYRECKGKKRFENHSLDLQKLTYTNADDLFYENYDIDVLESRDL